MFFKILYVFLWKNSKRLMVNWKTTIFIIGLPVALLSFLMSVIHSTSDGSRTFYNEPEIFNFAKDSSSVYYTPNNSRYLPVMERFPHLYQQWSQFGLKGLNGFENEEGMYAVLKDQNDRGSALIFSEDSTTVTNYFLRLTKFDYSSHIIYSQGKKNNNYKTSGFTAVQTATELSYLEYKLNNVLPSYQITEFANPEIIRPYGDVMLMAFYYLFAITTMIINSAFVLFPIVEEKEDGIQEMIDIATAHSYLNHTAIFIIGFTINVVIAIIIVLIQGVGIYDIFECAQDFYPIFLVLLFIIAMLSFSFLISSFVEKVPFALIVGMLQYSIPYLIFDLDTPLRPIFRFLSPMLLFRDGIDLINNSANAGICFSGADFASSDYPVDVYNMLEIYLALIGTSFLYIFLYYYISNVWPGSRGTPKPFYFLLTKSFWCNNQVGQPGHDSKAIVTVENLSKTFQTLVQRMNIPFFRGKVVAVDDVSFVLPENRISILLGRNAAGKSTIMSMITGTIPQTSGSVVVNGETDVSKYRSTVGYCPQDDILISYLNSRDHLMLFGKLRGLSTSEARQETNFLLEKVNLKDFDKKEVSQLSSVMKRRLCLACAVIGQTKLVILDEPSTGLDPESRRDLWDILLELRKERTILLTTHSMEEADVLGDKIIIMDHGTVVCEGTQLSLKKQYGSGYTLKILMSQLFDHSQTMKEVASFVANASVKSKVFPMLQLTLPYDSIQNFSGLLEKLESSKQSLGIESISMTNTTMEDVFLNSAPEKPPPTEDESDSEETTYIPIDADSTRSAFSLYLSQFLAIGFKKFKFNNKEWFLFLVGFNIPLILLISALMMSLFGSGEFGTTIDQFDISGSHIPNQEMWLVVNPNLNRYDDVVSSFNRLCFERDMKFEIKNSDLGTVQAELAHLRDNDPRRFYLRVIGVMELTHNGTTWNFVMMNQENIVYSDAYMINFATNMVLSLEAGATERLNVINWPRAEKDAVNTHISSRSYIEYYLVIFPLGFFFYIVFSVNLPFREETSKFRKIQNIPSVHFWLSSYLIDCLSHTNMSVSITMMSREFERNGDVAFGQWARVFGTICIIGYWYFALLYVLPKLFKSLPVIYTVLFFCIFGGAIADYIFPTDAALSDEPFWSFFVNLLPEFHIRHEVRAIFQNLEPDHSILTFVIYGIVEIVLFFAIILISENIYAVSFFQKLFSRLNPFRYFNNRSKKDLQGQMVVPDDMVRQETKTVRGILQSKNISDYSLVVGSLEGVDFSVQKGECFGLLGNNGAGKSSIFDRLTLNTSASQGDVYINGNHFKENSKSYKKQFGYCPDRNILHDYMTSSQLLKYMAWIKGTPYRQLDSEVKFWLAKMDLVDSKDMFIDRHSNGTKRKLHAAISMIVDPSLIFLDEPTTGVDPISRRLIWRCIKEFQSELKTIVLTSHNMDECEELCNRLAIMVSGKLRCIGDLQQLKEIYGTGFTLQIKLRDGIPVEDSNNIKEGIHKLFNCKIRDDYADTLTFNVFDKGIQWSVAFARIQKFCETHSNFIDDFAINESSLEDIVLEFCQMDKNIQPTVEDVTGASHSAV